MAAPPSSAYTSEHAQHAKDSQHTLLIFDFDHTLINVNSDLLPFQSPDTLPCGAPLFSHFAALVKKLGGGSWTRIMRVMLAVLARMEGYTKAGLVECLRVVEMNGTLKHGLREMAKLSHNGQSRSTDEVARGSNEAKENSGRQIEMVIASDANDVFINEILNANGLNEGIFSSVYTNYARWTTDSGLSEEDEALVQKTLWIILAEARIASADHPSENASSTDATEQSPSSERPPSGEPALHVAPYQPLDSPHSCPRCAANMCKSAVLLTAKEKVSFSSSDSSLEGIPKDNRIRTIYAGDGHNDYCPALSLEAGDLLLVREGFSLDRILKKDAAEDASEAAAIAEADKKAQENSGIDEQEGKVSNEDSHMKKQRVVAEIRFWKTQEELGKLLLELSGDVNIPGRAEGVPGSSVKDESTTIAQLTQDFSKRAVL